MYNIGFALTLLLQSTLLPRVKMLFNDRADLSVYPSNNRLSPSLTLTHSLCTIRPTRPDRSMERGKRPKKETKQTSKTDKHVVLVSALLRLPPFCPFASRSLSVSVKYTRARVGEQASERSCLSLSLSLSLLIYCFTVFVCFSPSRNFSLISSSSSITAECL